jgi:hypothetical protein
VPEHPQRTDDRTVRHRPFLDTESLKPVKPELLKHPPDQRRLTHPGLTRDQHDRATTRDHPIRMRHEHRTLGRTADQHVPQSHDPTNYRRSRDAVPAQYRLP